MRLDPVVKPRNDSILGPTQCYGMTDLSSLELDCAELEFGNLAEWIQRFIGE